MDRIEANLQGVRSQIENACAAAGRRCGEVTLLAVSKTFPPEDVAVAADAGQRDFGENYVQEGVDKILRLRQLRPDAALVWHCIGPLQSNKTRLVAENFDWVHSIDRLKIAQRLSEQRPAHLADLQVCIQINVDGGANKSGVGPDSVLDLARQVATLPRLKLRGLMSIPEPQSQAQDMLAVHRQAWACWQRCRDNGLDLDTLSMGMSADITEAIAAGSTMVRVGTAIFGRRG
jgi:PLP dependent protein